MGLGPSFDPSILRGHIVYSAFMEELSPRGALQSQLSSFRTRRRFDSQCVLDLIGKGV